MRTRKSEQIFQDFIFLKLFRKRHEQTDKLSHRNSCWSQSNRITVRGRNRNFSPRLKHTRTRTNAHTTLVLRSFIHRIQVRGFLALNVRFYWRQPDLRRRYAACEGREKKIKRKKKIWHLSPPMGGRYCYNDVAPRALASH